MMRKQRQGMDLEMEVMRICARELKKLPASARVRVADWLRESAMDEPQAFGDDPRQAQLFGGKAADT